LNPVGFDYDNGKAKKIKEKDTGIVFSKRLLFYDA
jgi:hypothetical protein